jgi:anthranilate synthase component 1
MTKEISVLNCFIFLKFDDFVLTGSSPEIMVSLKNKIVTIRPLAGTRKRGGSPDEDKKISQELLADEKEIAEHLMLIDLGRHDVGSISKPNSVQVSKKMIVEYYSHVMHLSSTVEGEIRDEFDAIDALIAGFPAGTVSGAPKIRAMGIIEEIENVRRSFYAGCVGYFASNSDMETCITLRSALIKDEKIYLQAGAGVVFDSVPKSEYQECINKSQALIKAYSEIKRFL